MKIYDVIVIGGGPAGLAAAISADKNGASVLLIEREDRLGGILKQCIHDGFGLITFKEKLTGPEYAGRYIEQLKSTKAEVNMLTFVTNIAKKEDNTFELTLVDKNGVKTVNGKTVVFATGCRERTSKQIFIQGTRPSGVFTAGTAQYLVNILGKMPTKRCVILGSGDIGLIMARRLTLEGAEVVGVYEAKSTPSGLTRNIHQCLNDFNIPLYLSHTVSKIIGRDRVEAVEIVKVDEKMNKIDGTEQIVQCDALVLSVGLIPENEVAEKLGITISNQTKGALIDNNFMTDIKGAFSCGNTLFVNDLVDYVSMGAEAAGRNAAQYTCKEQKLAEIKTDKNFLSFIPHRLDLNTPVDKTLVFFRSASERGETDVVMKIDGAEVMRKKYKHLKPPEMEKLDIDFTKYKIDKSIEFFMEDVVK